MSKTSRNPQGINYLHVGGCRIAIPHNVVTLKYLNYERYGEWGSITMSGDISKFRSDVDELLSRHLDEEVVYDLKIGKEMPVRVDFEWNDDDMKALAHCIEKRWTPAVKRKVDPESITSCKLCDLDEDRGMGCENCVIYKDAGQQVCRGMPYYNDLTAGTQKGRRQMLAYLKDLRQRMLNSPRMKR